MDTDDASNASTGGTLTKENLESNPKDNSELLPGKEHMDSDSVGKQKPQQEVHQSNDSKHEDDDEDPEKLMETLKGDRIGDTMYSERFVLSTILKLSKAADKLLQEDEEFERDLCNLWDMTVEPDVVRFLLKQDAVELFILLAHITKDHRLIEILVGIIGNMCCVDEMHDYMYEHSEQLLSLCEFLTIPDAPILIQLNRTLTTLLDRSDDERYRWFDVMKKIDMLTEKLTYVLATTENRSLVEHIIETIRAMVNRFTEAEVDYAQLKEFYSLFAKSCLLEGLFEAFRTLYPVKGGANTGGFDEEPLTTKDLKTIRHILEIHEHFIVYANELYEPHVEEVVQSIYRVLTMFANENVLFPVTKNHISVFVLINSIYSGIMYHFHCESFVCMVHIYELLTKAVLNDATERQNQEQNPSVSKDDEEHDAGDLFDADDDEEEFDEETMRFELLEVIFYLVGPIDEQIIRGVVQLYKLNPATIELLCRDMRKELEGNPLLFQICTKLTNIIATAEHTGFGQEPMSNGALSKP